VSMRCDVRGVHRGHDLGRCVTVVTPLGEKPALAVPAKHWPRVATIVTLAMDPVHWREKAVSGCVGEEIHETRSSECHARWASLYLLRVATGPLGHHHVATRLRGDSDALDSA
jgi:hypothetical protein